MPDSKFLESYPLYRNFSAKVGFLQHLPKPPIHMWCGLCKSEQTFTMRNEYWGNLKSTQLYVAKGMVVLAIYSCAACNGYQRYFLLKFGEDEVRKVGQEPPWEIGIDKNLERVLGTHADLYKKGLTCESQGYGLGAFSYYRRIVEEIIDGLLDQIADLLGGEERARYADALAKTKCTKVAQEKIDLVKDLLPALLRPNDLNPLSVLHDSLSVGLHSESDEDCLDRAAHIRESLLFLVSQVGSARAAAGGFTERMRKLLEKKKSKSV